MPRARAPVDLESLLARVDALVAAHGAVPRSELSALKRHLPALSARLHAKGYEIGTTVRRPLDAQLLAVIEDGFVPQKGLERRVAGASAREVKDAVERLLARRRIVLVMRESGLGYARADSDVLAGTELDLVHRRLVEAERLVRRARARAKTAASPSAAPAVLREDALAPLAAVSPSRSAGPAPTAPAIPRATGLADALTREIRRRMTDDPRPIRVPDVLRAVGGPADDAKRALLDGAARGLFQLEPESGMGRLSREDAALCPTGPMGTVLSWIVARDEKRVQ